MSRWLNLNGKILPAGEVIIPHTNRAFRYGDALFETMRMAYGKVQLAGSHFARLEDGARALKMEWPRGLDTGRFISEIEKLCNQNDVTSDARIRLTMFRNDGGLYTPETNEVSYLIEVEPMPAQGYQLNSRGYSVDVFPDIRKPLNALASLKTANSLMYVMAGVYKNQHNLDDCVIINEKRNICEAISSNIFVVKNGALYTPSLDEGCIPGVMRQHVLKIARENRIAVYEISLLMNVLLNADELFLTNAVNGVMWVGAYKGKRYFNNIATLFNDKLNTSAQSHAHINA
jgi:branched-subunit amino acid aminotransferase/4-amino-4-deoxychorismate lyase